jgi:uncharacterized protein YutD
MKKVVLENIEYELIEDYKNAFDETELKEKYTDYFNDFDYILGDYAYNKLRLKGFCEKNNSRFNKINDYKTKDKYLSDLCAYECRYFVLKKVKKG